MAGVRLERADAIPGFMHWRELRWLARQARQAQTIIEVGCWQGRSTRALADHCPGVVYAVDPWDGPYYRDDGEIHKIQTDVYEQFAGHLADHLETGRVKPYKMTLQGFSRRMVRALKGSVDLVFIDGDHRQPAVEADIRTARRLLRPGGLLSGHDYGHRSWPGVQAAVDAAFGADTVQRCRHIWWTTCGS